MSRGLRTVLMTAPKAISQAHHAAGSLASPISYPGGCAPFFELQSPDVPYGTVTQLGDKLSVELHGLTPELATVLMRWLASDPAAECARIEGMIATLDKTIAALEMP